MKKYNCHSCGYYRNGYCNDLDCTVDPDDPICSEEKRIDNIIDNACDYIYDDIWNEFGTEWVEDYLDGEGIEYDDEDVNKILEGLKESQKEFQQQALSEEKETLYQQIDEFIEDSDIHLDCTDIGKVLVRLANDYLCNE